MITITTCFADGAGCRSHLQRRRLACGTPWMLTLLCGFHKDRTPTHGYETAGEAAMAAFAKS
jgi:hypothetical protein